MKIRFVRHEHHVEILAPRRDTGRLTTFGFCHPATVPLIRKDGIRPHLHLIRLPEQKQ